MDKDYISRLEHEEFVKRMEDEHHRQNRRISEMEEHFTQLYTLTLSIEKMAMNIESLDKSIKRQWEHIEKLEEAPVNNWNKLKDGILGAIAAAIGGGIVLAIVNFI
jgi:uncharacterized protein YdcH (DUF465 family)